MVYDGFWDISWNVVSGCFPVDSTCLNCYAARYALTRTQPNGGLHAGVAERINGGRFVFNGKVGVLPPGHHQWTRLLRWPGAARPKLGPGKPSIVFVADMADLFYERRPQAVIDKVCATVVMSGHIGLLLTRRTARMADYFTDLNPRTAERWKQSLWLGFSAGRQIEFDARWKNMRPLAEAGWLVFAALAPMIGPIRLPPDYLRLARWCIVSGECVSPHHHLRYMDPRWALAVKEQCEWARLPFYMLQMTGRKPRPPDLQINQFPVVATTNRKF